MWRGMSVAVQLIADNTTAIATDLIDGRTDEPPAEITYKTHNYLFLSFVKFSPSLPLEEEGEQENPEHHHRNAHGRKQSTEAKAALKVYAEGYEHAVSDERTVHPAEPHGKREREPSESTKERAVENPFSHPEFTTREQHAAVQQHDERTNRRNDTHNEAREPPEP